MRTCLTLGRYHRFRHRYVASRDRGHGRAWPCAVLGRVVEDLPSVRERDSQVSHTLWRRSRLDGRLVCIVEGLRRVDCFVRVVLLVRIFPLLCLALEVRAWKRDLCSSRVH